MRKILLSALSILSISFISLDAKTDKSCQDLTVGVYSCNPYSFHFIKVKEIKDNGKSKLVEDRIKPSKSTNIVQDFIDRYVKINEPIRYQGTQEEVNKTIVDKEAIKHYVSIAQDLKHRREVLIAKIIKEEELRYQQNRYIINELKYQKAKQIKNYGYYKIKAGDSLSHIAYMFGLKTKELIKLNDINKSKPIKINQKIIVPYTQDKIEIISKAEYKVKKGDTLHSIAKEYNLKVDDIIVFNKYILDKVLKVGEVVKLPLPYKIAELKQKAKAKEKARKKRLAQERMRKYKKFGKHHLRVTATAYTSHRGQTDRTPFLAAWNNRIRPGMKIIAVSRDLLYRYGLRNGSKVKISGLRGYYTVRDKMNKRYRKRIDIYMGVNRRRALRWGRRSVIIHWD